MRFFLAPITCAFSYLSAVEAYKAHERLGMKDDRVNMLEEFEAFNATIARIVRRACGYRDLDYLFMKIRQEGNPVLQI